MAFIGGWLPERWDMPLAIGLGVIVTDMIGDTIKSFIGQFVPANWLDPAAEFIIGLLLFWVSKFLGVSRFAGFLKIMSYGAIGIAIADTIGIVLGIGTVRRSFMVTRSATPSPQSPRQPSGVSFR